MERGNNQSSSTSMGKIEIGRNGESVADLTGKVHQLPCCIKYDGPTNVSDYFKPKHTEVEVDGLSVEEAYFRGRKLQGTTVPLPQGFSGLVIGKRNPDKGSEDNPNCWEMKAKFESMTIWNHDILPSKDDPFIRAFHWLPVAKALHQPVSVQDIEATSTAE